MTVGKFLSTAATAAVLLLGLVTTNARNCRCLPPGLYEGFEAADVVLHGTALHR